MRLRISIRGRVRPSVRRSVRRSVRPSVPCYFRMTNMAIFEGRKSSNDITNNNRMSDDEVVASYVPPRYLFLGKSNMQLNRQNAPDDKTLSAVFVVN